MDQSCMCITFLLTIYCLVEVINFNKTNTIAYPYTNYTKEDKKFKLKKKLKKKNLKYN